ncbi:MAG TPA: cytochrome P450 [Mucilaginibacter sp.]|jgi:cytochrome P450
MLLKMPGKMEAMECNNKIPGPGLFKFVRNIRRNPVLYCYELMKQYGDVVKCPSVPNIYLISNPLLAKEVFLNSQKLFDRNDFVNNRLRKVMGDGVVLTTGSKWKRQSQTAQLAFRKEDLQRHTPEIITHTDAVVSKLATKATENSICNIHEEMRRLVMKIMAGCLLQIDDEETLARLREKFVIGNEYVSKSSPFNLPAWVPGSFNKKMGNAIKYIDNVILDILVNYHSTDKYKRTLLAYVIDQMDELGSPITKEEILAEVKNIFISSYFSTSDFLAWLFYSLAKYPAWGDKIYCECKAFNNFTDPGVFESVLQSQLFIHEVLRCYPPGWSSIHHTHIDFSVGNYLIPKNSTIFVSIYNVHHHPDFWQHPDLFNPNRFHPSNLLKEKDAFIPFGKGPGKCIGMGLAQMVINIVFAKMVLNFKFSADKNEVPEIQSRVSLGSKRDIKIRLHALKF